MGKATYATEFLRKDPLGGIFFILLPNGIRQRIFMMQGG